MDRTTLVCWKVIHLFVSLFKMAFKLAEEPKGNLRVVYEYDHFTLPTFFGSFDAYSGISWTPSSCLYMELILMTASNVGMSSHRFGTPR
jgi:hypothetical protein